MTGWGMGLGLLGAAIAVIAFVRYRERENSALTRSAALARELRGLAADDDVRLAAVDEFEQAIYQRLFYASVVAPWIRSAAWALLATTFAAATALAIGPLDGVVANSLYVVAIALIIIFGVATVVFVAIALFHTATTPRVSFSESYADDAPDDEPAVTLPANDEPTAPLPEDDEPADRPSSLPESREQQASKGPANTP